MAAVKAATQRALEPLTGQCADERPPACGLPDDNARALPKWPPACGLPLDNAENSDLTEECEGSSVEFFGLRIRLTSSSPFAPLLKGNCGTAFHSHGGESCADGTVIVQRIIGLWGMEGERH